MKVLHSVVRIELNNDDLKNLYEDCKSILSDIQKEKENRMFDRLSSICGHIVGVFYKSHTVNVKVKLMDIEFDFRDLKAAFDQYLKLYPSPEQRAKYDTFVKLTYQFFYCQNNGYNANFIICRRHFVRAFGWLLPL